MSVLLSINTHSGTIGIVTHVGIGSSVPLHKKGEANLVSVIGYESSTRVNCKSNA